MDTKLILKIFLTIDFEGGNARVHTENCSDDESWKAIWTARWSNHTFSGMVLINMPSLTFDFCQSFSGMCLKLVLKMFWIQKDLRIEIKISLLIDPCLVELSYSLFHLLFFVKLYFVDWKWVWGREQATWSCWPQLCKLGCKNGCWVGYWSSMGHVQRRGCTWSCGVLFPSFHSQIITQNKLIKIDK